MNQNKRKVKLKICIQGDEAVGKTAVVNAFTRGSFEAQYTPTINVNVTVKNMEIYNDNKKHEISLNIWDFSGLAKWPKICSQFLSGANGIIFVGDLTRPETFESLKSFWMKNVDFFVPNRIPRILLCNKADAVNNALINNDYSIGDSLNIRSVLKTSAKLNQNINYTFIYLLSNILSNNVRIPMIFNK